MAHSFKMLKCNKYINFESNYVHITLISRSQISLKSTTPPWPIYFAPIKQEARGKMIQSIIEFAEQIWKIWQKTADSRKNGTKGDHFSGRHM